MSDELLEMVKEIMATPVPEKESLSNPFKITRTRKISTEDKRLTPNLLAHDIKDWTARTFVDYFSLEYFKKFNNKYRKVYGSDGKVFNDIMRFMASNGVNKRIYTKKLIDWVFENTDEVLKHTSYIDSNAVFKMINYFFQEEILPQVEDNKIDRSHQEENILDEIQEADREGKVSEIFARFGIPVAATYFVQYKGVSYDVVFKGLIAYIEKLRQGDIQSQLRVSQIFQRSILRSPYSDNFSMLDWRESLSKYCKDYYNEKWWRDEDYKGRPLKEYNRLTNL